MDFQDRHWHTALEVSRCFLARWSDRYTRNAREDIAQETALEVWRCQRRLRAPDRFEAFVRTVSRRVRYHAIRRSMRRLGIGYQDLSSVHESIVAESPPRDCLRVEGRWVRKSWLLDQLDRLFGQMTELNRSIVLEFYSGRSCRDIARRFGLAEESVKVRLYRSRRRLYRQFVGLARQTVAMH